MSDEIKRALHIKSGCATPERDAGRRRPRTKSPQDLSPERLIQGIRDGDRSLLAKAITLVESSHPDDRKIAEKILENCLPATGNSIRVGVTGAPGAGKSSLIEALGKYLITKKNEKVAILAIDPSSQLSGGSILGDRTRMPFLSSSEMAFVRPSPSRGAHGGITQHSREVILLCEAAGYRNILVETVGVGQSETAIRTIVDFFVFLIIPGAGDELQGLKRGVMEMADLIAVNKADGDHLDAAEQARKDAENALHLLPASDSKWSPYAIVCSAQTGFGVHHLWSCVREYVALTKANGWFEQARREQERHALHEDLEQGLIQMFRADPVVQQRLAEFEQQVLSGQATATSVIRELMDRFAATIGSSKSD